MLVRVNIGRKAGQIQDIEFTAAKQMLADGRASEIRYDVPVGEAEGVAKLAAAPADSSPGQSAAPAPAAKSAKSTKK